MPASQAGRPHGLLEGLLCDGAAAVVVEPRTLPDGLTELSGARTGRQLRTLLRAGTVDPELAGLVDDPLPGRGASTDQRRAAQTAVLRRFSRSTLVAPLAFRVLAVVASLVTLLAQQGVAGYVTVLVAALVLVGGDVATVAVVLARAEPPAVLVRVVLLGDLALGLAAMAATSLTVPTRELHLAGQVGWTYLIGTAVLWTVAWGAAWGLGLTVATVAVHPLTWLLDHLHDPGGTRVHPLGSAMQDTLWMLVGVLTTVLALLVLGIGTRLAMASGIRAGREVERARLLRGVHDTVLQTLEAVALPTPDDRLRPATTLAAVRRSARTQAAGLRRALDSWDAPLTGSVSTEPGDEALPLVAAAAASGVAAVVDEFAAGGFWVELVVGDLGDDGAGGVPDGGGGPGAPADGSSDSGGPDEDGLTAAARGALVAATREALRNSQKHGGTDRALVYVERDPGGVRVVVRDHGCGFDASDRESGFGLRESIERRMAEVGGRAVVTSRPGRGTRVQLRLDPAAVEPAVRSAV